MQAISSKPFLATLLTALALGLTACAESDDTSSGAATNDESASLSIDTENDAISYESGDTSISVNAEDDEPSDTQ